MDEIYDALVVRPVQQLGRVLFKFVDQGLIDTVAVRGSASVVMVVSRYVLRPLQNGNVQSYATVMAVGMAALLWLVLRSHT